MPIYIEPKNELLPWQTHPAPPRPQHKSMPYANYHYSLGKVEEIRENGHDEVRANSSGGSSLPTA